MGKKLLPTLASPLRPMSAIQLTVHPHCQTGSGLLYQHVNIKNTAPDGILHPADLKTLRLPKDMIWSQGVILEGRAPIWVYGQLIPRYFEYHARTVGNLRKLADCLVVDVGGIPQAEKQPLVEQCSHYLVISRLAEAIDAWHQLCQSVLEPVAVVHSVLETTQTVVNEEPLELIAGPWINADSAVVPAVVLQQIDKISIY